MNLCSLADPDYKQLQRAAEARQQHARAPGTWANYRSAIKAYRCHCHKYAINEMAPTPEQITCWIEDVAAQQCPSSVANSVSHIRMFFKINRAPLTPMDDIRVKLAMDAIKRSKTHKPRSTPHVPLATIKTVVANLQATPNDRVVAFAILIMYYAGARQSEVAPRSANAYDHTRHTTRADVSITQGNLKIEQKWAKNLQGNTQHRTITLAPGLTPMLCPVTAYKCTLADRPTRHPKQPLLMFPRDGATITAPYIARIWKEKQRQMGIAAPYTLHAIRRTAATIAYASGSSELEVQRFGGWASQAHRTYISTADSTRVNKTLINAIS